MKKRNFIQTVALITYFLLPYMLFAAPEYQQHVPFEMEFETEVLSETGKENPFLDYRLQVLFEIGEHIYNVPGYFAADGDAANSGASEGKIWKVKFTPPHAGKWNYTVSFKKGRLLAIDDDPYRGAPIKKHDGKKGTFEVKPVSEHGTFFEKRGSIIYNNSHYLHTNNGEPLLLFGTNSPENFLAYEEFDGTYASDPDKNFIKSWQPHVKDWKEGDPLWMENKGKGIIGALNYLASKEMNVLFALTMNIEGDAKDVWPFISHHKKDFKRYDVSKLAQWDIVFSHAEQLGIAIELVLQEQENQLILDDGYTEVERKLYFRELIARFGYHKNIFWNIGEENGGQNSYWPQGQNDQQRFAMVRYIKEHDPYKHPVVMHTYPNYHERDPIVTPLLKFDRFDGLSMQIYDKNDVHGDIKNWIQKSAEKGRLWVVLMDELGPWHTGTKSDTEDPQHNSVRKDVLWGALTAGAGGVQWYFGWNTPPTDLNAEDLRSRNNIFEQSAIAKYFFEKIDFTKMSNSDELITLGNNYCFSDRENTFVIYLKDGGSTSLNLENVTGSFNIKWYNPRTSCEFLTGGVKTANGGKNVNLGFAPHDKFEDWVVLISK